MSIERRNKYSSKQFIGYLLCAILYRILLDYNYINVISPINEYNKFYTHLSNGTLSWGLFITFVLLGYPFIKTSLKFSSMLVIFLLFFKFIPFTSYIWCAPISLDLIIPESIFLCLILICFMVIPAIKFPIPKSNMFVILFIAILLILVIFYISGTYAHFRFHFTLLDVYELRDEARSFAIPSVLRYLHSAAAKILPLFLIYYMNRKNKIMVFTIILAVLLSFGTNGLKSTLFNLVICLLLYYFRYTKIFRNLPKLFLFLLILATIEFIFIHSSFINQFLVRRILFMPSLLDEYYFSYTFTHDPLYLNTKIHGIDIAYVIGDLWSKNSNCYANNGLFSDAFSNFGNLGIICYPILYAMFFKSIGKIIDLKDIYIRFFAAFITAHIFISSFFTVMLITHGVLLMYIAIIFMPNIKSHLHIYNSTKEYQSLSRNDNIKH